MTETTTIRVRRHTRDRAARIARETGSSVSAIIEQAMERYEEDRFWDAFDSAVEQNRTDQGAWEDEQVERDLWDKATLKAGLDPE